MWMYYRIMQIIFFQFSSELKADSLKPINTKTMNMKAKAALFEHFEYVSFVLLKQHCFHSLASCTNLPAFFASFNSQIKCSYNRRETWKKKRWRVRKLCAYHKDATQGHYKYMFPDCQPRKGHLIRISCYPSEWSCSANSTIAYNTAQIYEHL